LESDLLTPAHSSLKMERSQDHCQRLPELNLRTLLEASSALPTTFVILGQGFPNTYLFDFGSFSCSAELFEGCLLFFDSQLPIGFDRKFLGGSFFLGLLVVNRSYHYAQVIFLGLIQFEASYFVAVVVGNQKN